jgi:hypothetical protein
MAIDDSISSLLNEWNQFFPPRDFPPFKFIPESQRTTLPPKTHTPVDLKSDTGLLSRAIEKGRDEVARERHSKRVFKIYTNFCDYLVFRLVRKQLVTVGFQMDKLQESNPGKVSRVSLGLDVQTETVWWNHGLSRSFLRFRDLVRIDYGLASPCYTKLKKQKNQAKIVPWNCFSLVSATRSFDFYVTTNDMTNSTEVDSFLFGLSYVLSNEVPRMKFPVFGLFDNKRHLALIRGKMKIRYMWSEKSPILDADTVVSSPKTPSPDFPSPRTREFQDDDDKDIADEFFVDVN